MSNRLNAKQHSFARFMPELSALDGGELTTFFGFMDLPAVQRDMPGKRIQVSSKDRLQVIANKEYGTPMAWWVIAWANDLDSPDTDLYDGMSIFVPAASYVRRMLT